jgi:hypothetical protein
MCPHGLKDQSMVSLEITATTGGEINSLARPVLAGRLIRQPIERSASPLLTSLRLVQSDSHNTLTFADRS